MLNGKKMSSLSGVFRFAKLKTIILTTLVIAGVCGAAGFYYCNNMEQKTGAKSGDSIYLTSSSENTSYYGNGDNNESGIGWHTRIFTIQNGSTTISGFCADPDGMVPDDGNYTATSAGSGDSANRIKLMTYIQIGSSSAASAQRSAILSQFSSDTSSWFGYAHAIISYIKQGAVWNNGLNANEQALVASVANSTLAELISSNSTVWQEAQGYELYYFDGSQRVYWIEPENGGLKVQKTDTNTGSTTPQGDVSSFAGTKFTIYQSNGTTEVAQITADANGVATTSQNALPFGTYVVKETTAPTGYRSTDQSVTITVDDLLGALPYDTYEITELECPSNRNCRPLTEVKTFSITQNGVIVDLGEWVNDCDLIEYERIVRKCQS